MFFRTVLLSCTLCLSHVAITLGEETRSEPTNLELVQRVDAIETILSGDTSSAAQRYNPADSPTVLPCTHCGQSGIACQCQQAAPRPSTPTVKVGGFFQLDAGYYSQDETSFATLGDIEDGLGFRRARLSASGMVTESVSYMMEYDFAQAQARFVDVWMQMADTPIGTLRIGRFRQPFGMSELTSIRELPFLERPTLFALAPFRQTGAQLTNSWSEDHITWALAGYRYVSDNFGNVYSDTGGYGIATRMTLLPIDNGDDQLLHVGFDYSYNDPGRDLVPYVSTNEFFVGQNPLFGPASLTPDNIVNVPFFVNTGQIPTAHTNLLNVEGAMSFGSLVIQSEARWALLEEADGTDHMFPGAYLHLRYVLTGEEIPYNRKAGVFGRVLPARDANLAQGHWGAWEIASRVSYIDLDGEGIPGPGRDLTNFILGMNWYLNAYTKLQCDWIHSSLNDPVLDDSETDTLALRGQLDF